MKNLMQCDCKKNSLTKLFSYSSRPKKEKNLKLKKNTNVNIMNAKIANIYSQNYTLI